MRDIEYPYPIPYRRVFLQNPPILHRHLPPGERREARPSGLVSITQCQLQERLCHNPALPVCCRIK